MLVESMLVKAYDNYADKNILQNISNNILQSEYYEMRFQDSWTVVSTVCTAGTTSSEIRDLSQPTAWATENVTCS